MEFKELVEQRRSIRSYSEERITEEELKQIIECAQMAPSWKNSQTARYYAALSDEAIEAVRKALPVFNQNSSKNAAYIVSSFKKGVSGSLSEGELAQEGDLWGAYDLGLGNMYALFRIFLDLINIGLMKNRAIHHICGQKQIFIGIGVRKLQKRREETFIPSRNFNQPETKTVISPFRRKADTSCK